MLVNGKIPAGLSCPFLDRCQAMANCPTPANILACDFSCGFARAFELLKEN